MPQRRDDPYLNFNFRVEIDGLEVAGFSEVQIPEGRIEAVAYREGTDTSSAARLLPGRVEWEPVVLRRGFAGDASLFEWWNERRAGQPVAQERGDRAPRRAAAARSRGGSIRRAWPSKLVGPNLRGLGNEVAIETLELSHEGIELD